MALVGVGGWEPPSGAGPPTGAILVLVATPRAGGLGGGSFGGGAVVGVFVLAGVLAGPRPEAAVTAAV